MPERDTSCQIIKKSGITTAGCLFEKNGGAPDRVPSSMASLPAQTQQQQGQRPVESREMESERADLDAVDAVQLIAKTTSLTISGDGSEVGEPSWGGHGSPMLPLSDAAQSGNLLSVDAQPSAVTEPEWQADTLGSMLLALASCSSAAGSKTGIQGGEQDKLDDIAILSRRPHPRRLQDLPNEVLLHILSHLDVCDLLATSRTSHHLRTLSLAPYLHATRLRLTRTSILPPLLTSPSRPSRTDLVRRSILLSRTAFASRKLARSLAAIGLARRLAKRPGVEEVVGRGVLPVECLPVRGKKLFNEEVGQAAVAPALVARKRAVERERVKDGLRRWVGSVWIGEVRVKGEKVRMWEERVGVGRVWRLRKFWERVGRGTFRVVGVGWWWGGWTRVGWF